MLLVWLLLVASLPLLAPLMLLASLLLLLVCLLFCWRPFWLLTVAVGVPWILAVAVFFAVACMHPHCCWCPFCYWDLSSVLLSPDVAVVSCAAVIPAVVVSVPWILTLAVFFAVACMRSWSWWCPPHCCWCPLCYWDLIGSAVTWCCSCLLCCCQPYYCCRRPWNSCWLVTLLFLPPLLRLTSHLLIVFPTFLTSLLLLTYLTVANIPDNIATNAQLCTLDK